MSRRKSTGDQEFGSDSFLDIIANIVGILIILIVVVGVKVARQPALLSDIASSLQPAAELADSDRKWDKDLELDIPEVEPIIRNSGTFIAADPFSESVATSNPDELQSSRNTGEGNPDADLADFRSLDAALNSLKEPSVDGLTGNETSEAEHLTRQIDALTLELNQVKERVATTEQELLDLLTRLQNLDAYAKLAEVRSEKIEEEQKRLDQRVLVLQEDLLNKDKTATSIQATLTSLTDRQGYVCDALAQVAEETRQLSEVLEESDAAEPTGERLNHRLSPVSQSVQEGELHFRMQGGRIAHIPLEALLDRLKSQVSARRSVVMKFHRYEGMVGPEGGFHMQYTVQRDTMSPLQALQHGQSGFRISVSRWSILPADTLAAEPIDAALRIGSRFRQILEATEPDTVVTIWLYPNDFQYFHQVRELAHRLNLRVAARPLPDGVQIAGSPNGSRSSSQ